MFRHVEVLGRDTKAATLLTSTPMVLDMIQPKGLDVIREHPQTLVALVVLLTHLAGEVVDHLTCLITPIQEVLVTQLV